MTKRIRKHASTAFTLIELMVVLTIIALLAALLIPAVQSARESARRLSCVSNLKQLGLAINNYVASIGCFPFSVNGNKSFSAQAMLLPHLDERPLYDAINLDLGPGDPPNSTALDISLAIFICPSDGQQDAPGRINYAGNRGYGFQLFGDNGVFVNPGSSCITFGSIMDGSTNTACMSEWLQGVTKNNSKPPGQPLIGDSRRCVYVTEKLVMPSQLHDFISLCQILNSTQAEVSGMRLGSSWIEGDLSFTIYNHMLSINGNSCVNGFLVQQGAFTVSSNHPGVANVLAVDGHVNSVKASIALPIWQGAGTRAGGEIINLLDSY